MKKSENSPIKFNAALQGAIKDTEPDFLAALPMDNAVGAIMALSAELYLLRERLSTLELELAAHHILPEGAVEHHKDTPLQAQTRAEDLAAYTNRILSELARDRIPVSVIHPNVNKYLRQP